MCAVRKGGRSQLDVATPLSRTRGVFRCKVNNRRSLKVLAVAEPIVADKAHESDLVGLSGLEVSVSRCAVCNLQRAFGMRTSRFEGNNHDFDYLVLICQICMHTINFECLELYAQVC